MSSCDILNQHAHLSNCYSSVGHDDSVALAIFFDSINFAGDQFQNLSTVVLSDFLVEAVVRSSSDIIF